MEKALAFAVSVGIVGFGLCVLVAGLGSRAPVFWAGAALLPVTIGLLSTFGPK